MQGQPLDTAFLFKDPPASVPEGLRMLTNSEVKADALRPLDAAISSISFMRLLLWLVAATIIGSMLYLQAMERTRDFAVSRRPAPPPLQSDSVWPCRRWCCHWDQLRWRRSLR